MLHPRPRLRPLLRRSIGALALLAAVAAGCSSTSPKAAVDAPATTTTTTAAATTTTAATGTASATTVARAIDTGADGGSRDAPAAGTYAVGSETITWVDHTRKTVGDKRRKIAAADSRTLPVLILYPSTGKPAGPTAVTAGAAPAEGTFPVVVFSHGVTASGPAYQPFLAAWAAAGFVVAAPTYPMSSGAGAWADLTDYQNQPADVSFVMDQLTKLARSATDPLAGHLATATFAVAGHSLGAMTSLGFYNSCCVDKRVKAVIAISGTLATFPHGTWDQPADVPLLMIHGTADTTVPYDGGSKTTFAKFTDVPRALLTFPGAKHTDPVAVIKYLPSTDEAAIAFLDLELDHQPAAWDRLGKGLAAKGAGTLQVAGGLPTPTP